MERADALSHPSHPFVWKQVRHIRLSGTILCPVRIFFVRPCPVSR